MYMDGGTPDIDTDLRKELHEGSLFESLTSSSGLCHKKTFAKFYHQNRDSQRSKANGLTKENTYFTIGFHLSSTCD